VRHAEIKIGDDPRVMFSDDFGTVTVLRRSAYPEAAL
jgi:hypothetical protein